MKSSKLMIVKVALLVCACLCMMLMTACGTGVKVPNDYDYDDLSVYLKLGNYKGVEYPKTEIQVTQQEIMDYIDTQRSENATQQEVKSGTVDNNSVVNIDYSGKLNGEKFDGGTAQGYDLDIANSTFIDGFAEALVGHQVGETFDINVTFPSDYSATELAGKDTVFTITINSMKQKVIPEYNDAYVKKYTDYDSMEEYEKEVKEDLKEQKEEEQKTADKLTVFNKINDASELIKTPKTEYKARYNSYVNNYKSQAEENDTDLESYVSSALNISMDEFYAQAKEYAKKVVKQELVLHSIARKEDIKLKDSDFNDFVEDMLDDAGYTAKTYEQTMGISIEEYVENNNVFSSFLYDKVMDTVLEYSKAIVV